MTSRRRGLLLNLPFLALVAALGACSSIDNAVDCSTICRRYADCFNSSYDVSACESRCKSKSASDTEFQSHVNTCNACIDDRSCASATFGCAANCNGVVP